MNSFFSSFFPRPLSYITLSIPIFFLLVGCKNTIEILPNLCYNDKDGTYVCPSNDPINCQDVNMDCNWSPQIDIERVAEKPKPTPKQLHDWRLYNCRIFLGSDAWDWCMGYEDNLLLAKMEYGIHE